MRDADFKVGVALRQLVVCETECECDYWFTFFSGKAAVLFFFMFPVKKLHVTIELFSLFLLS